MSTEETGEEEVKEDKRSKRRRRRNFTNRIACRITISTGMSCDEAACAPIMSMLIKTPNDVVEIHAILKEYNTIAPMSWHFAISSQSLAPLPQYTSTKAT